MTDRFQVGVIASTHGLAGEVNVFPTTDEPERYKTLKRVTLDTGRDGMKELEIEHVKFFKKFVIVKFKGWDSINDVERFRGKELTISRDQAIKLAPGEYFTADLVGLMITDEDGKELGTLTDVIKTGANDVYEMKRKDNEESVMIPAIADCVKKISLEEGIMVIHVMDGLMDRERIRSNNRKSFTDAGIEPLWHIPAFFVFPYL